MNAYEFIKNCYPFYFLTISNDQPQGRPFGAIYFTNDKYYLATANNGNVYNQVIANSQVQLLALKEGTRCWLRISGKATICQDVSIKEQMLVACPILSKHYTSAQDTKYALIEITPSAIDYHSEEGIKKLL